MFHASLDFISSLFTKKRAFLFEPSNMVDDSLQYLIKEIGPRKARALDQLLRTDASLRSSLPGYVAKERVLPESVAAAEYWFIGMFVVELVPINGRSLVLAGHRKPASLMALRIMADVNFSGPDRPKLVPELEAFLARESRAKARES